MRFALRCHRAIAIASRLWSKGRDPLDAHAHSPHFHVAFNHVKFIVLKTKLDCLSSKARERLDSVSTDR